MNGHFSASAGQSSGEVPAVDDVPQAEFPEYCDAIARRLSRGHETLRHEIMRFMEAHGHTLKETQKATCNFAPFDFRTGRFDGQEIERVRIEMSIERLEGMFKVTHASHRSLVARDIPPLPATQSIPASQSGPAASEPAPFAHPVLFEPVSVLPWQQPQQQQQQPQQQQQQQQVLQPQPQPQPHPQPSLQPQSHPQPHQILQADLHAQLPQQQQAPQQHHHLHQHVQEGSNSWASLPRPSSPPRLDGRTPVLACPPPMSASSSSLLPQYSVSAEELQNRLRQQQRLVEQRHLPDLTTSYRGGSPAGTGRFTSSMSTIRSTSVPVAVTTRSPPTYCGPGPFAGPGSPPRSAEIVSYTPYMPNADLAPLPPLPPVPPELQARLDALESRSALRLQQVHAELHPLEARAELEAARAEWRERLLEVEVRSEQRETSAARRAAEQVDGKLREETERLRQELARARAAREEDLRRNREDKVDLQLRDETEKLRQELSRARAAREEDLRRGREDKAQADVIRAEMETTVRDLRTQHEEELRRLEAEIHDKVSDALSNKESELLHEHGWKQRKLESEIERLRADMERDRKTHQDTRDAQQREIDALRTQNEYLETHRHVNQMEWLRLPNSFFDQDDSATLEQGWMSLEDGKKIVMANMDRAVGLCVQHGGEAKKYIRIVKLGTQRYGSPTCGHDCYVVRKLLPHHDLFEDDLARGQFLDDCDWLRPGRDQGLGDDVLHLSLFSHVCPNDLMQGELGNCWLVSAMAALAEFPAAVMRLFEQQSIAENGRYVVSLYSYESRSWQKVVVDDRLPVKQGMPKYAGITSAGEIWPCILEKAVAKYASGYPQLAGGVPIFALGAFTGCTDLLVLRKRKGHWDVEEPRFASNRVRDWTEAGVAESKSNQEVLAMLQYYDDQNFLVCCGRGGASGDDTSEHGFAYSLVCVKTHSAGFRYNMLCLRNAWGAFEWKGAWSERSELWDRHPEIAQECGHISVDDGLFWMEFEDFVQNFTTVYVCKRDMGLGSGKRKIHANQKAMRAGNIGDQLQKSCSNGLERKRRLMDERSNASAAAVDLLRAKEAQRKAIEDVELRYSQLLMERDVLRKEKQELVSLHGSHQEDFRRKINEMEAAKAQIVDEWTRRHQQLDDEHKRLQEMCREWERKHQQAFDLHREVQDENTVLRSRSVGLEASRDQKDRELEDLRSSLDMERKQRQEAQSMAKLHAEERRRVEEEAGREQEKSREEMETLSDELDAIRAEREDLERRLIGEQQVRTSRVESLNAEIEMLKSRAHLSMNGKSVELDRLESERKRLQAELSERIRAHEELQRNYSDLQRSSAVLEVQRSSLQADVEAQTRRRSSLTGLESAELKQLRDDNAALRMAVDERRQAGENLRHARDQITEEARSTASQLAKVTEQLEREVQQRIQLEAALRKATDSQGFMADLGGQETPTDSEKMIADLVDGEEDDSGGEDWNSRYGPASTLPNGGRLSDVGLPQFQRYASTRF